MRLFICINAPRKTTLIYIFDVIVILLYVFAISSFWFAKYETQCNNASNSTYILEKRTPSVSKIYLGTFPFIWSGSQSWNDIDPSLFEVLKWEI